MNEGILLVNKPSGITSHDVVSKVRKHFNMKRVGHAGTLDPLATGLLIMLLGRSTKLFDKFVGFDKAYRATMILGRTTDSADTEGAVISEKPYDGVTQSDVEKIFTEFLGKGKQIPPMYSAVKHKGKKLYELARKGITVERQARDIEIYSLKLLDFKLPFVEFYLECSTGTYVRQLAEDIGVRLECGACISQIERTKVGQFTIDDAIGIKDLDESHIRDWSVRS